MPKIIETEIKQEIIALYKQGVELKMIANLQGVSLPSVQNIVKKEIILGNLKPRNEKTFGKPATPKGFGKGKYIKKGRNPKKKLTPYQERQLLVDYFEKNMTYKQVMNKYSLWQSSIKRIIDKAIEENLYKAKGSGNHTKGHRKEILKNDDNRQSN